MRHASLTQDLPEDNVCCSEFFLSVYSLLFPFILGHTDTFWIYRVLDIHKLN